MSEEKKQMNNNESEQLDSIRTYVSDMADVVRDKKISLIKIASAEQRKRERGDYYQRGEKPSKNKFIVGGIIFIIITIIISYFLIQNKKSKNLAPQVIKKVESIVSSDKKIEINIPSNIDRNKLISLIKPILKTKESPETIKEIYLTKSINENTSPLTTDKLFSILEISAPNSLIRSFADIYMLGVYYPPINYSQNSLFLVIKTKDYDRAYLGMLEWEKNIIRDLFNIFNINISGINKDILNKPFEDVIIKNKDARVLYNKSRVEMLYYLFANKNTLIISTNKNAVKEIVSRILIKQK